WRWAHRAVTGPVEEALGTAGHARFALLPGTAAVTVATVDDGGIGDLFAVYAGLNSGRVILLTAHGWDPRHQRLGEWLAAKLNAEYQFLRSDTYGHHAAARLVEGKRVARWYSTASTRSPTNYGRPPPLPRTSRLPDPLP